MSWRAEKLFLRRDIELLLAASTACTRVGSEIVTGAVQRWRKEDDGRRQAGARVSGRRRESFRECQEAGVVGDGEEAGR
ncbi:hypothetical protein Dda_8268 [Drechslerella dactyloides]|uniref:Uncharacterized protein n=1 Tax=Drechslerella dactyloides TaxID=74499 RepID=A0AAD6NGH5_DREDA|nr:hypothetical protein Dda_8268 [Drechslerella dactyloides]